MNKYVSVMKQKNCAIEDEHFILSSTPLLPNALH